MIRQRERPHHLHQLGRRAERQPGQANYAASKAGLIGFAKSVALEVASRNITVNVVAPGMIETDMTSAIAEKARGVRSSKDPARPAGHADEVASAVCFLASDEAAYITGQVSPSTAGCTIDTGRFQGTRTWPELLAVRDVACRRVHETGWRAEWRSLTK